MLKWSDPRFFALIAAIGGLAILSSTMAKTPVLPLFAADLGATPSEIGWIVIASTIPGILISFPAGAIADALGRRRVIVASLLVFATAPLLYLPVTEIWQLTAVRFYHGFATAIFGTVATAAIAERYPDRRGAMLSTYASITTVGRSAAPFLGGLLISVANYQSVYAACAISGAIACALGFLLPPEASGRDAPVQRPLFFAALRTVLRERIIVATSLIEAAQFLVYGAIEAFLALYADSIGIPAWQIGIVLGIQLVAVVLVKPLAGMLSDRWGRRAVMLPGLALGVFSVAGLAFGADVLTLGVLSVLYGIAFATVTSATSALVADAARQGQFGASIGVLRTIMDIGQTLGPLLTGLVVGFWGYFPAFAVLAAILAFSALPITTALQPRLTPS